MTDLMRMQVVDCVTTVVALRITEVSFRTGGRRFEPSHRWPPSPGSSLLAAVPFLISMYIVISITKDAECEGIRFWALTAQIHNGAVALDGCWILFSVFCNGLPRQAQEPSPAKAVRWGLITDLCWKWLRIWQLVLGKLHQNNLSCHGEAN